MSHHTGNACVKSSYHVILIGTVRISIRLFFLTLLFIVSRFQLDAQLLPELSSLDSRDNLFQQIGDDIQAFYRARAVNTLVPELSIYQYRVKDGDTLFSLAAKLNLPQSSITTINRLDTPDLPPPGKRILIPNVPGMFIPEEPISDFEKLISRRLVSDADAGIELSEPFSIPFSDGMWRYVSGSDFTGLERRAFFSALFQNPLPGSYVSSRYGLRRSPFTGKTQFHYGIDLVPTSTFTVRSAAEGTVRELGNDPIYGKYIRIEHRRGYASLYAHLETMYVEEGSTVRSGEEIGTSGSTGRSTGNHLHFELFYLGENRDPAPYIGR
ncbi:MAG: LysM peptidoglycan-binding domain-containing M23 family metallopeptidase [Salinispira sp.]